MTKHLIFVALALQACASQTPSPQPAPAPVAVAKPTPAPAPTPVTPVVTPVPPKATDHVAIIPLQDVPLEKTCPLPGVYSVVDISEPVDQKFLWAMRMLGVKTVIRYYDWVKESIPGKTATGQELKLLKDNGMSYGVVFQHNNGVISTFTSARGKIDADRIVALAKAQGQPQKSVVYVGIDSDFVGSANQKAIKAYFGVLSPLVRKAGYLVGMYGSGTSCNLLRDAGLIDEDLCWIAGSTGWSGYSAVVKSNRYSLLQKVNQHCGGKPMDFDTPKMADFGQWSIQ